MLEMPESDVQDGIGSASSAAQAFQIFQITAPHLSPGSPQKLGACIVTCKAEHLVACADKLRNNSGTDESCGARDENTHITLP
jgi:hypothetical protein